MNKHNMMTGFLVAAVAALAIIACIFLLGPDTDATQQQAESVETTETHSEASDPSAEEVSADLAALVNDFLAEQGVDTTQLGIVIEDFESGGSYSLNATTYFTAASTYKLPLAMIYYDKLATGALSPEDTLYYDASCYEEGGTIGYDYQPGDAISLEALLHEMIVESDNTAAHILYENLGGWMAFKKDIAYYSAAPVSEDDSVYYSYENMFTADYMSDVLAYLYAHEENYGTLLEDMLASRPDDYLNAKVGDKMAQKYGQYEMAENAVGLAMEGHPYSIAVYTALGYTGSVLIGDLNDIVWTYFN